MDEYKLMIIDSEGKTDFLGNPKNENEFHIICLLEFIKNTYPNNELLKHLSVKHAVETIGYFVTLYGNVIFFNTTKNVEKHGKTGYLMFPPSLTKEQQDVLEAFCLSIPDYQIQIFYDLKIIDGLLEGEEVFSTEPMSPVDILSLYYQKMEERKIK